MTIYNETRNQGAVKIMQRPLLPETFLESSKERKTFHLSMINIKVEPSSYPYYIITAIPIYMDITDIHVNHVKPSDMNYKFLLLDEFRFPCRKGFVDMVSYPPINIHIFHF